MSLTTSDAEGSGVATARRGMDPDLLEQIYRREATPLLRLVWLYTGDQSLAEEVTQDAFVRLNQSWDRVRDEAAAGAYLRSIALNLARSSLRHRRVVERKRPQAPQAATSAETEALLAANERRLLEAVRGLPDRQRACVLLRYYADLEPRHIAESLGLSVNSVKTHLRRGIDALEEHLGGER